MAANRARETALRVLMRVLEDGRSLDASLETESSSSPDALDPRDTALSREIAYGVLRWYEQLREISRSLLAKPLRSRDQDIGIILLMGLYQLQFMRVPQHAAVSATVDLVRYREKTWAVKLINACLRRYLREREDLTDRVGQHEHLRHAHPAWLVERLKGDWPTDYAGILDANQQRAPMTLRVNTRLGDRESYAQELQSAGYEAVACGHAPEGLTLSAPVAALALPGFAEGAVSVQDEAAQLVVTALGPVRGRVLDACAAPGGKSAHLLERNTEIAELVCLDISDERLEPLRANLERLSLEATVLQGDAASPESWFDAKPFDVILVDAPCSATGVIRRHPDIKLHRRAEDIEQLTRTQMHILQALWPLLVPDGRLMYATCSVLSAENDAVVQEFIATQPGANIQPLDVDWGRETRFGRQVLPGTHGMDGFYYALLHKAPA